MRHKVYLVDGIDKNDALELTDSIGEKIIARMNLQILTRKIYCNSSKNINKKIETCYRKSFGFCWTKLLDGKKATKNFISEFQMNFYSN